MKSPFQYDLDGNVDKMNHVNSAEAMHSVFSDTCAIIEEARERAYSAVNVALTLRNWRLGERIAKEHLGGDGRAEYGKLVIRTLAEKLTGKYGKGFDRISLHNYVRFYGMFPSLAGDCGFEAGIVDAPRQLSSGGGSPGRTLLPWTIYRELIRVEDSAARSWYEAEAAREAWSSRTLHRNIASQYYSRMLQSQRKDKVADEMRRLTDPFRRDERLEMIKNPVVAEFLGLAQNSDFTESELEKSIITHIRDFLLEMGKGFAFVARQKHLRTDMGDFYVDLVFYNYILKCFFLIDLKTEQISHQDVGQMDMYVRMYDRLQRRDGDNPTIGLLLCSETSEDMARYSVLHGNEQIFQAKYMTCLPTKEELVREIERQKEIFRLQHEE